MESTLAGKLGLLGIVNAASYATKLEQDEWDWEGLVSLDSDSLDALVRKVGMKEGSCYKLQQHMRACKGTATGSAAGASTGGLGGSFASSAGPSSLRALENETDGDRFFREGCRWLYGYGDGVNYTSAAVALRRGAELKHPLAAAHLASCLMSGRGCAVGVPGGTRACELEATMWGMRCVDGMGLGTLASETDASADVKLAYGLLLAAGVGVDLDPRAAMECFRYAAKKGDAVAMMLLAGCIEEGHTPSVEDVRVTAADWYLKAAERGVVQAQSNYALTLMNGQGVRRDERQALAWFLRAAEQGCGDTQSWLGLCYQDGRCGVVACDVTAARWYAQAAESGDADAQAVLGTLYKEGRGVPKNDARALECFMAAAAAGAESAQEELRSRGLAA